jgi:hypothetical protein
MKRNPDGYGSYSDTCTYCSAPVLMAKSVHSRSMIALNPLPTTRGDMVLLPGGRCRKLTKEERTQQQEDTTADFDRAPRPQVPAYYHRHFDSCSVYTKRPKGQPGKWRHAYRPRP